MNPATDPEVSTPLEHPEPPAATIAHGAHGQSNTMPYIMIATAAVAITAAAFFTGQHVGYQKGYATAYASEHSHYLFEKTRGDRMAKRIAVDKACVATVIKGIPPVEDGGFIGIGEQIRAIAFLARGTSDCNMTADFGFLHASEVQRIFPSQQ